MSNIITRIRKALDKTGDKSKEQISPAKRSNANPAPTSTPTNLRLKSASDRSRVITRKDDLPAYVTVLDASSNLALPESIFKKYAILVTNTDRKEVIIVSSTETNGYKSSGPDIEYMSVAQSIARNGYTRRTQGKVFASPEIISIIYDNQKTGKSAEEQKRTATKIQLDFDELLRAALAHKTSDIHIEVRRNQAKVRFRKNGDLFDYQEWSVTHARTMAGVIYQVIADEKDTSFDESRPQDALIDRDLGDNIQLRVRLATIPAYPSGFDMIMRLLQMGQDGKRQSLDQLGYERTQLLSIRRAVSKPVGAVIMAGTTGSGKSTSLNSMLGEKIDQYDGSIKVITVEDPPEYALHGATQVPVVRSRSQAQAGNAEANPFAAVVRAAMRSDPDILMVGEVRDEDSAELLIHAVQSGHQVFTTVHAGSGIDIISRLRSNGIPDDVLGGQNFISALMFQSLLPILCPHCSMDIKAFASSISSEQDQDCLERIYKYIKPSLIGNLRFERSTGCEHCSYGRIGRSVASEVILPDPYMLSCFRNKQDTDAFMHYRRRGGKIALEHGLLKAIRGQMDIRSIESKLDQITALEELHISLMTFDKKDPSKEPPFMVDENIFLNAHDESRVVKASEVMKEIHTDTAEDHSGLTDEPTTEESIVDDSVLDGGQGDEREPKSKLMKSTKKMEKATVLDFEKNNKKNKDEDD